MTRFSRLAVGLAAVLVMIGGSGCSVKVSSTTGTTSGTGSPKTSHDLKSHEKGHDHDHDHAHLGPNGGDIVEIGEEEYHAEWTHDHDSGLVTVFILDKDMKKEVPIEAAEIEIATKVADGEKTYKLAATNASEGDNPTASRFALEDKTLMTILDAAGTEGTAATLNLTIAGKPYAAKFEQHEHKH